MSGVGKTYAMLEAAWREHAAGRDVVVGFVETHGRKETDALAEGLPTIPRRQIDYRGVMLTEMDLDAVLARKPQIALVDELAHTNTHGSRHPKRYHDVQELLDAGIDVITTLNVQHVESRADTVLQVTGAEIRETVPDSLLDDAVIELVDLPPTELVQRLHQGKVYLPDRALAAAQNFFREGNLTALRELALRLVADHVGLDTREYRQTQAGAATGILNLGLMAVAGPRVPGLVFLFLVVLLALKVGRGPVLLAGALSALVWNFFFLPPRLTFVIENVEDGILFGLYFVVSIVLGQLVARIRAQEQAERRREERAVALYELTRDLAEATSRDEVIWQLISQVNRVFRAPVAIALSVHDKLAAHPDGSLTLSEKELGVADWAFRHQPFLCLTDFLLPTSCLIKLPPKGFATRLFSKNALSRLTRCRVHEYP